MVSGISSPPVHSILLQNRRSWLVALGCVSLACQTEEKSASKGRGPSLVQTALLAENPFVADYSLFGEVRAASDAQLSVAESGRVRSVHVREGAVVKKGQLLVELDDSLARVQLNEAVASRKETKARTEQAQKEVESFDKMREEQVVSALEASRKRSEAETLGAATEGQAARVAQGAERLRRHKIVAPFDGVVAERAVDPGDWLNAGQVALRLLTDERVEVQVQVPARVLDGLKRLKGTLLRSEGKQVAAQLESSVNALDRNTRTALVRLMPQEEVSWLRVGASVHAVFQIERSDGLNLPRNALVYGVASAKVFRVVEGKAQAVPVKILANSGEQVLVESGELKVGDRLVIRGNERLRPGQSVAEEGALVPGMAKE